MIFYDYTCKSSQKQSKSPTNMAL